MSEELKGLVVLAVTMLYIVMLAIKFRSLWNRLVRRMTVFCRRPLMEVLLLTVAVAGVVHQGATKGTNGNDRATSEAGNVGVVKHEDMEETNDGDRNRSGCSEDGIRFTAFAVDTNAVHLAVSLPLGLDLPDQKLDLFAAQDLCTNFWELVGNYDISYSETNLVDSIPLSAFPFQTMDRLFLQLGTRADLDGDGLMDVREKLMYGTSPFLADTDGDGLADGEEFAHVPPLDPLAADSDGDGYLDGEEVLAGTDPLSQDAGAEHTIRYFYDDDDRLISANSGEGNASSGTLLSPSGNELRTTAIGWPIKAWAQFR